MTFNNPFGSLRKQSKIEGVLGNVSPDYAEDYYPEMSALKERIAANVQILEVTKDTKEMQLLGRIIQRDKLALIELKKTNHVPLAEDEKLAA